MTEEMQRLEAAKPLLTIAIPTFNRAPKLARLLEWLERELCTYDLTDRVSVLVSNNASPDDTAAVLEKAAHGRMHLQYYIQPENLLFDGNILFLYQHMDTPYLWFLGDDDEPLSGAISIVLNRLESQQPDVLLAPFVQPPGSWRTEYEYPEPYRIVVDPGLTADLVAHCGKLSVYVLRTIRLNNIQMEELAQFRGGGYMFQVMAFTVLQASLSPKLLFESKPIITSDDDFCQIPWIPVTTMNGYSICAHSFVRTWAPNLSAERRCACYLGAVRLLWDGQTGRVIPLDPKMWDKFAAEVEWRWPDLCRRPVTLVRLLLVKLHLGYSYRNGLLRTLRYPLEMISHYCRCADWLTAARCQFRRSREYFRRRRVFGDAR